MTEICLTNSRRAERYTASDCARGDKAAVALGAADWLSLAAAPTFAIMAVLTGVLGGGVPDVLCAAAQDASPLSGMVLMYTLMSAFHVAPWLRLMSGRRSGAHRVLNPSHDRRAPSGYDRPSDLAAGSH